MIAGIEFTETGTGAPVICLHGIGGGADAFASFVDDLPHFRMISVNLPGYCNSTPFTAAPSFEDLSNRLGALIDGLQTGPVHLVGHSIGGMIALEHAIRKGNQVASLTLVGTTPAFGGRDESFKDAFLKARLAPLDAGKTMAEIATESAPHLVGPGCSGAVIAEIAEIMSRVSEETWRGILQCLVTFNRRADLGDVKHPCCLIAGTHDQNAPARTMQKMADQLPNAEIHILENIGHMIPQEAPDDCARIISNFIGNLT